MELTLVTIKSKKYSGNDPPTTFEKKFLVFEHIYL